MSNLALPMIYFDFFAYKCSFCHILHDNEFLGKMDALLQGHHAQLAPQAPRRTAGRGLPFSFNE